MGGIGSGRYGYYHRGAKQHTTDSYRTIDVREWSRKGLLTLQIAFTLEWLCNHEAIASLRVRIEPDRVAFTHHIRGRAAGDLSYIVPLDRTPCHLGGKRPWFLCPGPGCGRRVAILYDGGVFLCRHCLDLVYPIQRDSWGVRIGRRAERICGKLGWKPDVLDGGGE